MNFTKNDKNNICEYIIDTHRARKNKRKTFDLQIAEIDRQLRMEPDRTDKKDSNGTILQDKAWMPEAELPLQSQTLEVTSSDIMRMLGIKASSPWFSAHSLITDSYLNKADFTSLVSGDTNDVATKLTQDNVDKLVYGVLNDNHKQIGFRENVAQIIGESVKYSVGVGRGRFVNKHVFLHSTQGVMKDTTQIPVMVPVSIKNVFLDDSKSALMNEGHIVSPGHIFYKKMKLKDVKMAMAKGNTDPNDMVNGGWFKKSIKDVEDDGNGDIEFLEWEGDLVVSRKSTESMYLPNGIFTVIIGYGKSSNEPQLVRMRKNKYPYSSYIGFPFHMEHIDCPYGSSPLMKGRPVQASAVYALNRLLEASAYDAQPAVQYDEGDEEPEIYPGAKIQTSVDIKTIDIGNPTALFNIYAGLNSQYSDVTAVNAPRLGAQTISHTTAYSKDVEVQRGQARTVDFVDDVQDGPLTRWLNIEYQMTRDNWKSKDIYIPQYGGWAKPTKNHLPEQVMFDVYGAGGPAEESQKKQMRFAALQQAIQMDTLKMQQQAQLGQPPTPKIDIDAAIEQILHDGGWTDIDQITQSGNEDVSRGNPQQAGMEGGAGGNPGNVSTALQALAFGGGQS